MKKYSKKEIHNTVLKFVSEGRNTKEVLDFFLMMKMSNDLGGNRVPTGQSATISSVNINLIGNKIIEQKDYGIIICPNSTLLAKRLFVRIAPSCTLFFEDIRGSLSVKVNDKNIATMSVRGYLAEDIAMWIIRQKQKYNSYLDEWNNVIKTASQKAKSNHLSMLAIKAIFTDSMKEYPDLCYNIIEQIRRLRIKIRLPNSKLGVFIDAWWGSYKQQLPQQIKDLKILIETHRKIKIKDFFRIR